jgi:hypothetical protein
MFDDLVRRSGSLPGKDIVLSTSMHPLLLKATVEWKGAIAIDLFQQKTRRLG